MQSRQGTVRLWIGGLGLICCFSGIVGAQEAHRMADFGGGYSSLSPQQKRLVDDWFLRFSEVVHKPVDPADGYDRLPLSAKTTLNAVTHALTKTTMTDESGKSLAGSALELVEKVDSVAGEVLGARGDAQFRLYVQIRPGALRLLNESREFKHGSDNTVYHKGYPICYRTRGGTPSIQVSLSRDGSRADIDVDYHSSSFPAALVNGHLSASNSDVRDGDNDVKHNRQWAGLQNWWRNLLGLPLAETSETTMDRKAIEDEPRLKDAKPADAVFEFLNNWLVGRQPQVSIAYIADEAFACTGIPQGRKADRGMVRFTVLQNMGSVNQSIGKVSLLGGVSAAVPIAGDPRMQRIDQAHPEFALYEVREDLAEELKCDQDLDAPEVAAKARKSKAFGKYVGAVFRMGSMDRPGRVVATLWRKDQGYWKLISYKVDPDLDRSAAPHTAAPIPVQPLAVVSGDKAMIEAASTFLKLWLLKKDIPKALQFVAPECRECARVYHPEDSASSAAEDLLKKGMETVADAVGPVKRLDEAIGAPTPYLEDLKLVKHGDDKAFVLVALPEHVGEAARCDRRDSDGDPVFSSAAAAGYGKYYATGFSLNRGSQSPAVCWIVWSKVSGSWKAMSYVLLTP
jgi:hypothetical protein